MDDEILLFNFDELIENNEMANEKLKKRQVNLDMWGGKTSKYHKKCMLINKYLKPFRLSILKHILEVLQAVNVNIMVYGGSALCIWRDNGKIIPHDHDIDLAILESDFLTAYNSLNNKEEIVAEAGCPFSGKVWFNEDETQQILYDNVGVKRMKVYFKESYIKEMAKNDPKFEKLWKRYNRNTLNLDIFGLQRKTGTDFFRVTWNLPGLYDNDKKCFPENVLFPLKEYILEGIPVLGPRNLYEYLSIEYGYLEKDARYDRQTQLYVKLTDSEFKLLPAGIKNYMKS